MDDLISRKTAIDAIEKYDFNFPEYMERFVTELRDVMKEDLKEDIAELPPAQPEIIRCKDCKHYIPYEWMFDGLSRSSNIDDYSPDEIGCSVNGHNYPPDGFCSFAERRTDG